MRSRRLVFVLAVCLVAACQVPAASGTRGAVASPAHSATPTPTPSGFASRSPTPTLSATSSPTAADTSQPPPPLIVDRLAQVMTSDLRMRSEPGVQDGSRLLEPLLQPGTLAFVLDGPRSASGYEWYRIAPVDEAVDLPRVGWVALAAKDGEQWIEPVDECPPAPRDGWLEVDGAVALACYGDVRLDVLARIGSSETGPCFELELPWTTVPPWLDECNHETFLVNPEADADAGDYRWVGLAYPPGVEAADLGPQGYESRNWRLATITGQFDHPSARTCRVDRTADWTDEPEPDPDLVALGCRSVFAVESIRYRDR
jgi:hypothetical protein